MHICGRPRTAIGNASEDLFPRPHGHNSEYADVYLDIQADLLRSIMRNPSVRGILAIRHGMLPSRLNAWLLPVRELPAIVAGLPAVYRELLMIYREIPGRARIPDARAGEQASSGRRRDSRSPAGGQESRTRAVGLKYGILNEGHYCGILTRGQSGPRVVGIHGRRPGRERASVARYTSSRETVRFT